MSIVYCNRRIHTLFPVLMSDYDNNLVYNDTNVDENHKICLCFPFLMNGEKKCQVWTLNACGGFHWM